MVSNPNGTNFTVEVPSTHGKPHSKFKKRKYLQPFPKYERSSFRINLHVFSSHSAKKLQMHTLIWLKFETYWSKKVNLSFKFGANLIKIYRVIVCIKVELLSRLQVKPAGGASRCSV